MSQHRQFIKIANVVRNCTYCQPLSGCILSGMKNKEQGEIVQSLMLLSETDLHQIISYHQSCPYQEKVPI